MAADGRWQGKRQKQKKSLFQFDWFHVSLLIKAMVLVCAFFADVTGGATGGLQIITKGIRGQSKMCDFVKGLFAGAATYVRTIRVTSYTSYGMVVVNYPSACMQAGSREVK
jgi:hypothetical protein